MPSPARFSLCLALALAMACGDDDDGDARFDGGADGGATPMDAGLRPPTSIGPDERPATVRLPAGYSSEGSYPVVVLLHGYGANGFVQEAYFGLRRLAGEMGFIAVVPDGTEDAGGSQFWNATDSCCDFASTGVDDVAYLGALIDEALEVYAADPDRVYLLGHSNGGFMSYRMACDASEKITAIASLAGATWGEATRCGTPAEPTSVLQIHGTADDTIPFEGGTVGPATIPSARESVDRFAERAGCDIGTTTTLDPLDFTTNVDGAETTRVETTEGCTTGTSYALWTIEGGGHIPALTEGAAAAVLQWLLAQGE